ncbi:MAG: dethiobiotin synthase [Pseudomonadota bacterium]
MYFITGTDTNIGKTLISAILTLKLRTTYFKPIQSGDLETGGDTAIVKSLTRLPDEHFLNPAYALNAPLSPHLSARYDSKVIDLNKIIEKIKNTPLSRPLIIEGAGGVYVPVNDKEYIIDLIAMTGFEAIIVARSELGTLNHTFLTIEALRARNIPIKGVILNGETNIENQKTITAYSNIPILGHIPIQKSLSYEVIESLGELVTIDMAWESHDKI